MALGVTVRAASLGGTLVLTRFLTPADYGAISIAAVVVLSASRVFNLGLGPYVIANASPPDETSQALFFHVTAAAMACGATVVFRHEIASAAGVPEAAQYFPGLALSALVLQISHIPSAVLMRSLRFRIVATSRAIGELAFTVTSTALAPIMGGMAIVAGNVVRAVLVSGLLLRRSNLAEWLERPRPKLGTLRRFLRFGAPLTGAGMADAAATQWDNLLVGRLFGPLTVGHYALAYNLASTPAGSIAEPISDVLLPSFAKLEPARRRDAFLRAVGMLGFVSFPVALGLAAVATRLIDTVLDPRWAPVGPMLALLSGISLTRPLAWVVDAYLQRQNRTGLILALNTFRAAAVLGGIATIGTMGPLWACGAVSLALALHVMGSILVLAAAEGISVRSTVAAAGRPLLAAAIMAAIVFGVDRSIGPAPDARVSVLLTEIALGSIGYAILGRMLVPETAGEFQSLMSSLLSRRRRP